MDVIKENPILVAAASIVAVLVPAVMYLTTANQGNGIINQNIRKVQGSPPCA